MKVLLSAFACDPTMGSEPGNGWNWSSGLAEKGFEIHCLTRIVGKENITVANNFSNLHFHYVKLPFGLEKWYLMSTISMYAYYLIWQYYAYRTAKKIHREEKFDLAHHVTWGSLQMGSFMYKLDIPFIFGPAGGGQNAPEAFKSYFGKDWNTEEKRNFISRMLLRVNPACKAMLRKAKVVLASNPDTLEMAKSNGCTNVHFSLDAALPQIFFPEIFTPKVFKKDSLELLWIGRFMPRKGLLLVLEVMRELKEYKNISLTIVGDGETRGETLAKIKEYGLGNCVHWKGKVPYEEVKNFYLTHDLFFFTSLRDSCPAQLIEAMAYGLPVVTLNLHGQAIIVNNDTGIRCECSTPELAIENLKKAILSFYHHEVDITKMSNAAYQFALKQTWRKKIDTIVSEYY